MYPARSEDHAVSTSSAIQRGIQIDVTDPEMQAYLQRYPFAGPDVAMNRRGRAALASGLRWRAAREAGPVEPIVLSPRQAALPPEEEARVLSLMQRIGLSAEQQRMHLEDFAWEANMTPRSASHVLVIGCGDGVELLFLRAVLPNARIKALDYYKSLLPGLEEAVGVDFEAGDVGRLLPTLQREYDLLYSNHTMEHLYSPDTTLALLAGLLVPGATMISAMPAVGMEGMPYLEQVQAYLARREKNPEAAIGPLDAVYFDTGHPWKTTPDDLTATLERAGVKDVKVYQREGHWSRPLAMSAEEFRSRRERMVALNRWILGPLRRLVGALTPAAFGDAVARYVFALERRLPFGTNRVMNLFSEELLFVGRIDHE